MKAITYTKQDNVAGIEFNGQFVPADELKGTDQEAMNLTEALGLYSLTATLGTIQKAIKASKRDTHAGGRKILGAGITSNKDGTRSLVLLHAGCCPASRRTIKEVPAGVADDLEDGGIPHARGAAIYRVACKREAASYGFTLAMTPKEAATCYLLEKALA